MSKSLLKWLSGELGECIGSGVLVLDKAAWELETI
jgi:hypothetical protein